MSGRNCVTHHICDCQAERMRGLEREAEVLDLIRLPPTSREALREKARMLMQTDGEGWAIGRMVQRACELFDALEAEL